METHNGNAMELNFSDILMIVLNHIPVTHNQPQKQNERRKLKPDKRIFCYYYLCYRDGKYVGEFISPMCMRKGSLLLMPSISFVSLVRICLAAKNCVILSSSIESVV